MSKLQILARKRNFAKFRLMGITTREIREVASCEEERALIHDIDMALGKLKDNWEHNSKKLGLNPRVRCWCGKEAKYPLSNKDSIMYKRGERFTCKHHRE